MPAVLPLNPLRLFPARAKREIRRLGHTLRHSLRLASDGTLLLHGASSQRSRAVPSAWGARRDDYRWARGHRDDIALFRNAAASLASVLVHRPIAAWADLMPGAMCDVIGTNSELYLADYWTLTLHHLVWAGHLSYTVDARWERGGGIHDQPYCFVSELPTDLAQASREALILFEERAARAIHDRASFVEQFSRPLDLRPYGPPIYEDGRWRLPLKGSVGPTLATDDDNDHGNDNDDGPAEAQSEPSSVMEKAPATPADAPLQHTESPGTAGPRKAVRDGTGATQRPKDGLKNAVKARPVKATSVDGESAEHDADQSFAVDSRSFTVRYGGRRYRFSARNKQMFALLERISRRPGYRVTFDELRGVGDVWDGANVEDGSVRSSIARLRDLLRGAGMAGLAARIATGTYGRDVYVILNMVEGPD